MGSFDGNELVGLGGFGWSVVVRPLGRRGNRLQHLELLGLL